MWGEMAVQVSAREAPGGLQPAQPLRKAPQRAGEELEIWARVTAQGLPWQRQGADALQQGLRDPVDPRLCQAIGQQTREAGIEAIACHSARCEQPVVHVAAISGGVFASTLLDQVDVQTEATADAMACRCSGEGVLPPPAP